MNDVPQSTLMRPAVMERQELRKFTGEALRVGIPWSQHPAWSIVAERHGALAPQPPPAFSDCDIRAMISGRPEGFESCPRCGYVLVETR